MSDTNIFDSSTNEDQNSNNNLNLEPQLPTEVIEFVGQGKKYSSVEEALKSVPHAQKHIQTLESDLQQLKEELAKRRTTEELLDELKSGIQPPESTSQQVGLDKEDLTEIVNRTLEFREAQKKARDHTQSVASKFKEKFGETAQTAYETLAAENGLTVQQLNTLAATSPNAVLKLAGIGSSQVSGVASKTSSSINTEALQSNPNTGNLSAKVPKGATTRDLVNAWKIAGEKVKTNTTN